VPGQAISMKYEMAREDLGFVAEHDYYVVNDDLDTTLSTLMAIRTAEQVRRSRLGGMDDASQKVARHRMLFYSDPLGERLDQISDPPG